MASAVDDELARLHREVGWSPLGKWWAKLEILLGLTGVGVALVAAIRLGHQPEREVPEWAWLGPVLLVVLGGYLALAGHRSHLYQSSNRLAAYLAGRTRSHDPGATP